MSGSSKDMTAVEKWNRAVAVAYDDDGLDDEADAMTDAEIEAELRAGGVDVDAFNARSDALYAKYFGAEAPSGGAVGWVSDAPPPAQPREARSGRRAAMLLAYAAAATVTAGGIAAYVGAQHQKKEEPMRAPRPAASAAPAPVETAAPKPVPAPEKPPPDKASPDKAPSDKAPSDKAPSDKGPGTRH